MSQEPPGPPPTPWQTPGPGPEPIKPPWPPRRRRWLWWAAAGVGAVVVLVVVLVVALKPGNITVKGTMQDCTGLTSAGDQVTVTSASGTVLATGTLSDDNSKAAAQLEKTYDSLQLSLGSLSGGSDQSMSVYDFTLTVPGGQPRYGLNAGHGGTVWFTPDEMSKGPGLTLGCSQ